ncbi:MAG: oxidation resistance protein 1 [Phylliscum demangeonii]|nr:MAG: oxidation resistance protein 1 [Phylliscum demangeonii]
MYSSLSHSHSHSQSSPAASTSSRSSTPPAPAPAPAAAAGSGFRPGASSTSSSPSSSFYLPSASSLAVSASGFLKRFYRDSSTGAVAAAMTSASPASIHTHGDTDIDTRPPRRAYTSSPFQPPPLSALRLHAAAGSGAGSWTTTTTTTRTGLLLSRALAEEIRSLIPPRLQLADEWHLAYSLERDGVSLATLYERCARWSGGGLPRPSADGEVGGPGPGGGGGGGGAGAFVIVVKDGSGGSFGGYLSDAPRPSAHYYGTGECFLWRASIVSMSVSPSASGSGSASASAPVSSALVSSLPPPPSGDTSHLNIMRSTTISAAADPNPDPDPDPDPAPSSAAAHGPNPPPPPPPPPPPGSPQHSIRFKAFPYSGINDYMILCDADYLSLGGGDGHYGLWLDACFERGISCTCATFGNEPLSDEGDRFDVLGVEVWAVGGGRWR